MTATDTDHIAIPDAPAIAGLRVRRFREDLGLADYERLAEIESAANLADDIPYLPDAENVRLDMKPDQVVPARDIMIAEVDGVAAACAGIRRMVRDGTVVFEVWGHVTPTMRRRGLGRALLHANVGRIRERVANETPGPALELGSYADDTQVGHVALLESEGFETIRHFFVMRHPDVHAAPEVVLPDGLEIRPVTPDQHRAIFDAEVEAFLDHWGQRVKTDDDFAATHARPEIDTSLWTVAWDGDQVAGVVQTWIWPTENERLGLRRGWLEHVSVRRPWRRRGLGRAIVADALHRLAAAGMDDAMLGVDSQNPTGAMGLYTGTGFVEHMHGAAYRKPIER